MKRAIHIFGFETDAPKEKPPRPLIELLGAIVWTENRRIFAGASAARRKSLRRELQSILSENELIPAKAARIRGRIGHFTTLCLGKVGGGASAPSAERQYARKAARAF